MEIELLLIGNSLSLIGNLIINIYSLPLYLINYINANAMKTKQKFKLKMYNAVTGIMNENNSIWAEVEKLKTSFETFELNTNLLNELKAEHEKDLQPLVELKAEKRIGLIKLTVPVVNIILAFAHDEDDKDLLKKFNFSRNKLAKSKDLILIENCKTVFKTAGKLVNKSVHAAEQVDSKLKEDAINIFSYGLSNKLMTDLELAVKDFIDSHLNLRNALEAKNKCIKKITEVMKENDKLLRNKLDLIITIYKNTQTEFYVEYCKAREIEKDK